MDPSWTSIRITKQTEWINRLCTAFHYGQNNKIGEKYHLHTADINSLRFPSLPRSNLHVRGIKHQAVNQLSN